MSDMKLDNFRLLINDFSASFHFWHEIVGLKLIYRDENSIYAYFEAGSIHLELLKADYFAASVDSTQPALMQAEYRGVVVFRADDVDATYADLVKRGAPPLAPPQDHPAGFARTALLLAPDGYVLEVFTSLRPLPKRT
jgi:catechol 2,3-dioxygenase-like lactoylglutathione lyase family enzyme